jgi:hypothetical protein
MSNKRITDLTELTNPTTDDVFPVVDIATNTTTKVQLANLPVQTAVTTALATKQDSLVSGTNIKTVNSTTLLGSGDVAVQETLVSGTNIKTLNSVSLLGAGNIVLAATPSGVSGAIQFSDGSAFASDATKFFWDNTNKRLGVGLNNPSAIVDIKGVGTTSATTSLLVQNSAGATLLKANDNRDLYLGSSNSNYIHQGTFFQGNYYGAGNWMFGTLSDLGARLGIKGSGSTSATTSLLVQNSAGSNALTILDNLNATFGGTVTSVGGFFSLAYSNSFQRVAINNGISTNPLSYLRSNGVGQVLLVDNTEADFNRLQFGGTSASFPSLKRASNNLEIRNADDTFGAGLSIGAALNASAILQASSTTKGFLPPVMTTTQKNAIASPAAGLVLYDSTTNKLQCYNGSTWNDLF